MPVYDPRSSDSERVSKNEAKPPDEDTVNSDMTPTSRGGGLFWAQSPDTGVFEGAEQTNTRL